MRHDKIAPPTGTWRRIRAALTGMPQMRSHAEPAIHPAWCTCSDCSLERHRRFRRADLVIIGLAVAAALAVLGLARLGVL